MSAALSVPDDTRVPLLAEIQAMRRRLNALEAAAMAGGGAPLRALVYAWTDKLANIVAQEWGCSHEELLGDVRTTRLIRPRFTWVWLVRTTGGYSYPQTARLTGYTDHTSVIHACRRVDQWRADDIYREATDGLLAIARALRGEKPAPAADDEQIDVVLP